MVSDDNENALAGNEMVNDDSENAVVGNEMANDDSENAVAGNKMVNDDNEIKNMVSMIAAENLSTVNCSSSAIRRSLSSQTEQSHLQLALLKAGTSLLSVWQYIQVFWELYFDIVVLVISYTISNGSEKYILSEASALHARPRDVHI